MRTIILKGDNKMNKEIKQKLEKYVLEELDKLSQLDSTSVECESVKNSSIKNINILVELLQKEDVNISNEYLENRKIDISEIKNNSDCDLKREEISINTKKDIELRNDRVIKVLIDGATILVPVIFYSGWLKKGFEFEETGTYCSNTFKNLIGKFKPTK